MRTSGSTRDDLFGPLATISGGLDARRTSVLAGAPADQFKGAVQQRVALAVQGLGKSDAAWVSVIDVQIRLEKFFGLA